MSGSGADGPELPAAACVTVVDSSLSRRVAVRSAPSFALATNSTEPSPVPLVLVARNHGALPDACHPQPVVAATPIVTVPPAAATSTEESFHATRHAAASWRIDVFVLFTVRDAVRLAPAGLTVTTIAIAVWPWPLSGVTRTQAESESTFHTHSRAIASVAAN
jgi:hypothetical protein